MTPWGSSGIVTPSKATGQQPGANKNNMKTKNERAIMSEYTKDEIELERLLVEAANEEGTIQAGDMLRLAPHHRPELHTTMSISRAFEAITGKRYDADYFCD